MTRTLAAVVAFAAALASTATLADPHKTGLLSSVNVGVRFSSTLAQRGVIVYDDYQIDPVLTVFLLDDRIEYLGDSIGFRDFIAGDWLRFRTRLLSITDDPLFPDRETVRRQFPDRPDTVEWANGLELFLPGYNDRYRAELDLHAYKDLDAHDGLYVEATGKLKLAEFHTHGHRLEPNLVGTLGWGSAAHNRYLYGPDDAAGISNVSIGFWLALPDTVDRYYPNLQLTYFTTVGSHRDATFSQDHGEGVLLSFITAVRIL